MNEKCNIISNLSQKKIVTNIIKLINNTSNTIVCLLQPFKTINQVYKEKSIQYILPYMIGRKQIGIGDTCKVYLSTNKKKVIKLCPESNKHILETEYKRVKNIFKQHNSRIIIPSTQFKSIGNKTIIRQDYIPSDEKLSIKNSFGFRKELKILLEIVYDCDQKGIGIDLFGRKGFNYSNPTINILNTYPILENIIVHNGKLYFIDIEKTPYGFESEVNNINEEIILEMLQK